MSAVKYVLHAVRCDFLGCIHEDEGLAGLTLAELRSSMRAEGWQRVGAKDFCPEHAGSVREVARPATSDPVDPTSTEGLPP